VPASQSLSPRGAAGSQTPFPPAREPPLHAAHQPLALALRFRVHSYWPLHLVPGQCSCLRFKERMCTASGFLCCFPLLLLYSSAASTSYST
ncbi:hypothetical protein BJX68DRAFT_241482, partial [Aspergillus pseudodeflectus]